MAKLQVDLVTAEGRIMPLRFTGKASDCNGQIAHVDIHQGLPAEADWRRRARSGSSKR